MFQNIFYLCAFCTKIVYLSLLFVCFVKKIIGFLVRMVLKKIDLKIWIIDRSDIAGKSR